MKEEGDDRYKQIDGRIASREEKFSMIDEASEINANGPSKVHEDQNHGKAVATGFHGDTSVRADPSSITNTKTSNLMSKNKWKNGLQKTRRNDCEQS